MDLQVLYGSKKSVASKQELLTTPVLCCALWLQLRSCSPEITRFHLLLLAALRCEVILGGPGSGKSLLGSSLQPLGTSEFGHG